MRKVRHIRPLMPGISVSHDRFHAGTLGCFVCERNDRDRSAFLLSNNHVIGKLNRAEQSDAILQPARGNGGSARDAVATFERLVRIDEIADAENRVDAAIARLLPEIEYDSRIPTIGIVSGIAEPTVGMTVCKVGAVTGYTEGHIVETSVQVHVNLHEPERGPYSQFVDQFRVEPTEPHSTFAKSGDSGALIVSKSSNRGIGLFFSGARDGSYALGNPLEAVFEELDVTFV